MKYTFFILLLFLSFLTSAQVRLAFDRSTIRDDVPWRALELNDNNFLFFGTTGDPYYDVLTGKLFITDSLGTTIHHYDFPRDSFTYFALETYQFNDSIFVITLNLPIDNGHDDFYNARKISLYKFDLQLQLQEVRPFYTLPDSNRYLPSDGCFKAQTAHGIYLTFLDAAPTSSFFDSNRTHVLKIDGSGNILWHKKIDHGFMPGVPQDSNQYTMRCRGIDINEQRGELYFHLYSHIPDLYGPYGNGTYCLIADTNFVYKRGFKIDSLIQTPPYYYGLDILHANNIHVLNDNFLLIGNRISALVPADGYMGVMEFDHIHGGPVKTGRIPDTAALAAFYSFHTFTAFNRMNKETFLFDVTDFNPGVVPPVLSMENNGILVACLDSTLHQKWKFFENDFEANVLPYGIIATKDGGCIVLATLWDHSMTAGDHDFFILKFGSRGSLEHISSLNGENKASYTIYPNPGKVLFINAPDEKDFVFQFYDARGVLVSGPTLSGRQNYKLPTSDLPADVYFYQIVKDGLVAGSGKWIKQ